MSIRYSPEVVEVAERFALFNPEQPSGTEEVTPGVRNETSSKSARFAAGLVLLKNMK